jgi:hypothetical protein
MTGAVPSVSSVLPATRPAKPIEDTRDDPTRPRINASDTMPTAAPMPKVADKVPTSPAPPPSSAASDGARVIEGSDAMPTVVTATSARSRGRSRQTYLTAVRTR